jgi:hypothetical protein
MRALDWTCGGSTPQTSSITLRLRMLQRGNQLVLGGYLLALLVAFPAFCFWLSSQEGVPLLSRAGLVGNNDAETLGLLLACGAAGLAYLLLLVGQWLCLYNAPQSHGAKELAFACVLLAVFVAPVNVLAFCVGGAGDFEWLGRLLQHPVAEATWMKVPTGTLLQLFGALLLLGNILVYTQFLRALLLRANQEKRAGRIEAFCLFVCLVVGGSFGVVLAPPAVRSSELLLPGVVLAWLLVVLWQAWLILGACDYAHMILGARASGGVRMDPKEPQKPPSGHWIPLKVKLR